MSIRKLFDKQIPQSVVSSTNMEDLGKSVESSGNIEQRIKQKNRFIPQKDYSLPQNFAKFGSAEKYYSDSFNRLANQYPYDGSLRERAEYLNNSTYLDLYIFDNVYPRTTGYTTISPNGWGTKASGIGLYGLTDTVEYIQVIGGPHTSSGGMIGKELPNTFGDSNVYNPALNRESNLKFDFNQGVTVETWIKKKALISTADSQYETIFHLTNDATGANTSGSLSIVFDTAETLSSDTPLSASVISGAVQAVFEYPGITTGDLIDDNWHHIAFSFQNSGSDTISRGYLDGQLKTTATEVGKTFGDVTGSLIANLGAMRPWSNGINYVPSRAGIPEGSAKLSGSLDEFRYWKTARTSEQIGQFWFTQYGGGTNNDDANTDLGVYLKFNEGITGVAATDSIALDYSGRISNGKWVGYTSDARSTGSAIDLYLGKESEFRDPIIYTFHPEVVSTRTSLEASGSTYDLQNNSSFYFSMPSWIIEEDDESGQELLQLSQVLSSYLDTLYLQIENYPKLKDIVYPGSKTKPLPFAHKLLDGFGLSTSEIFVDATILEQISNRNEDKTFDLDLTDIKNLIYKNIYNNLTYIYKSKGNMKSFRNLMRCYGIDTDLVKINLYSDNATYRFRDNYEVGSARKKYLDFNNPDRFGGTVYQYPTSLSNSRSFISASGGSSKEVTTSFTLESEVIFPKKLDPSHPEYFYTNFITASLFGFHTADPLNPSDLTWAAADYNIQVYSIREEEDSKNVYFQVDYETPLASGRITSSLFYDVYENEKWNLALRFSPATYGIDLVSGSGAPNRILELYGVNSDAGIVANEFSITASLSFGDRAGFINEPKRIYGAAHHTNFTGLILEKTDVKLGSIRYWTSFLSDEVIKTHARDPENFGVSSPNKSAYLYATSLTGTLIPEMETLALNWAFDTLTGSDASGFVNVPDLSSGSAARQARYGWLGEVLGTQHPGRGNFFPVDSSKILDTKFIYSGKQTLPENIQSSDMVNIDETDNVFKLTTRPEEYFFSIEKSMYQNISEEILNVFSTISDFGTLVGDPVNRYRQDYKQLSKLRQLFFERVQNEPDLDKYIEFYKWIDNSLSNFLNQLIPASAKFSDNMRTMVESHVLERNKYWTKFPTIDLKTPDPEAGLETINKLLYNYDTGRRPSSDDQKINCFWWNQRAERSGVISSGDTNVDLNRQAYLNASLQVLNRSYSTPYKLVVQKQTVIVGGAGFSEDKKVSYAKNTIPWEDPIGDSKGIYLTSENVEQYTCIASSPSEKRKLKYGAFTAEAGMTSPTNPYDYDSGKGDRFLPFSIFSASHVNPYSGDIISSLGHNLEITNNHNDSYGATIGVPMQGPFTEKFVGGMQSRHTDLNDTGTDTALNRPEAWQIKTSTGVVKLASQPVSRPRAMLYRDHIAKSPVNIRNIKQVNGVTTGFVSGTLHSKIGNYRKDYEIVQAAGGRTANNRAWVKKGPWNLLQDPSTLTASAYVAGMFDEPEIQRGRTEYTMVCRFSSPGGPDTMGDSNGGPGLDRYAAEFAPNNSLNWRNSAVRDPLKNWMLTPHVNQFGYYGGVGAFIPSSSANSSNYSGTGSIYQINRNARMVLKQQADGTVITSSAYDNYYVQKPIPATDLRYAWITASVNSVSPTGFGYWPKDFYAPSLTNAFVNPVGFVSSSQLDFDVDFVGMNNYIYEPIPEIYTSAIRTRYQTIARPVLNGDLRDAAEAISFDYQDILSYRNSNLGSIGNARLLNALNLHRNGPYQSPAWKQSRTGQHKISRHLRRRNFIGCTQDRYLTQIGPGSASATVVAENTYTTFYYEPPVQKVSIPLRWTLGIAHQGANPSRTPANLGASLINAYGFVNPELANCSKGIKTITKPMNQEDPSGGSSPHEVSCLQEDTAYGAITGMYLNGGLASGISPVDSFVETIYETPTFPAPTNKFSAKNRERTNYSNTYYKTSRSSRTLLGNDKFKNGDD